MPRSAATLAREGAIVGVADIRLDAAEAVVTGLELPARARAIALDVADAAAWDATIAAFVSDVGRLDILVNNAATHTQALVEEMSDDEWHRVLRTNADSVFFGVARPCARCAMGPGWRDRQRRDRPVRGALLVGLHRVEVPRPGI